MVTNSVHYVMYTVHYTLYIACTLFRYCSSVGCVGKGVLVSIMMVTNGVHCTYIVVVLLV